MAISFSRLRSLFICSIGLVSSIVLIEFSNNVSPDAKLARSFEEGDRANSIVLLATIRVTIPLHPHQPRGWGRSDRLQGAAQSHTFGSGAQFDSRTAIMPDRPIRMVATLHHART